MNPLKMLSRGGAVSEPSDADFENVTLLLHGDGTNGAQNNTFLDSSTNNFTITRNGNTTQGTFSPFSKVDGRWGNYFDGTGDYLTFTGNSSTNFNGNDWCVETWFYMTKTPSTLSPLVISTTGTNNWVPYLGLAINSNLTIYAAINATGYNSSQTVSLNTWNHIAMVRSGGVVKVYLNGTATSISVTADINNSNLSFWIAFIGPPAGVTEQFGGYLSNLRMVDGSAVYTSNFTPPTAPLTAITNTSLLTCQSNRFIDNSSNNFTITRNGDVRVTPFSPFPTLTAYDAATNGGSGYFDGSGDYLSVADSAALTASGDFTLEAWYYPLSNPADAGIISMNDGGGGGTGPRITISGSTFGFHVYNNTINAGTSVIGQWHHLVLVRSGSGSNNCAAYVNGVRVGTATNTTSQDPNGLVLGRYYTNTNNFYANAYIAGARYVVGTAVYNPSNSSITVPTAPPTAVSNTAFLANFTNAGILDNTMSNNLETVGNAQIDTTTKKYGTGALEFDGSGDYLDARLGPDNILIGDFTVELWVYPTTITGSNRVFVLLENGSNSAGFFMYGATGYLALDIANVATYNLGSTAVTTNSWQHIAFVRSGSTLTGYINGTATGTATVTASLGSSGIMRVGAGIAAGAPYAGFIDDLRITKGKARYTSNFTPPTAAFEDIGT